jgi:hypothetical protein
MGVEAYEVGQRSDKRGVDLISDALPFRSAGYEYASAGRRLREAQPSIA